MSRYMRTRNQAQIRKDWPWGPIRKMHVIGDEYLIVEYRTRKPSNAEKGWRSKVNFHPIVKGTQDGRPVFYDCGRSFSSMDSCLVGMVVFKREWANHGINAALNERLTSYIMRALDGPETD